MRAAIAALLLVGACAMEPLYPVAPPPEFCVDQHYPVTACEDGWVWQPGYYTITGNWHTGWYTRRGPGPRYRDHRRW